MSRKDEPTI